MGTAARGGAPDAMTDDERDRATFGPFDALRAVSDLQAQGIRAAGDVASRLTGLLDDGPSTRPGGGAGDLRAAVSRLVDAYGDVLERTVDAYADLVEQGARRGGGSGGTTRVDVVVSVAGEGTGELWIGNDTGVAAGPLRLIATTPVAADGVSLAGRIKLDPPTVDALGPGAARIAVSVIVDPGVTPGYYHGYVLVPELPGEALPLTVVVR